MLQLAQHLHNFLKINTGAEVKLAQSEQDVRDICVKHDLDIHKLARDKYNETNVSREEVCGMSLILLNTNTWYVIAYLFDKRGEYDLAFDSNYIDAQDLRYSYIDTGFFDFWLESKKYTRRDFFQKEKEELQERYKNELKQYIEEEFKGVESEIPVLFKQVLSKPNRVNKISTDIMYDTENYRYVFEYIPYELEVSLEIITEQLNNVMERLETEIITKVYIYTVIQGNKVSYVVFNIHLEGRDSKQFYIVNSDATSLN